MSSEKRKRLVTQEEFDRLRKKSKEREKELRNLQRYVCDLEECVEENETRIRELEETLLVSSERYFQKIEIGSKAESILREIHRGERICDICLEPIKVVDKSYPCEFCNQGAYHKLCVDKHQRVCQFTQFVETVIELNEKRVREADTEDNSSS